MVLRIITRPRLAPAPYDKVIKVRRPSDGPVVDIDLRGFMRVPKQPQISANAARTTFQPIEGALADYPPALLLGGLIKFNTGQYAQAEASINRFLASTPDHVPARRTLAAIQLRSNNTLSAIEALKPLVADHPDDLIALVPVLVWAGATAPMLIAAAVITPIAAIWLGVTGTRHARAGQQQP